MNNEYSLIYHCIFGVFASFNSFQAFSLPSFPSFNSGVLTLTKYFPGLNYVWIQQHYKNGKLIQTVIYYPDGKVKDKVTYEDGKIKSAEHFE